MVCKGISELIGNDSVTWGTEPERRFSPQGSSQLRGTLVHSVINTVTYFKQLARHQRIIHHRDSEGTELRIFSFAGRCRQMKRALLFEPGSKLHACRRRLSFDLQSSPCKSKNPTLCELCASSEAGGEIPFLSQSMNRNQTDCGEYVSVFMKWPT